MNYKEDFHRIFPKSQKDIYNLDHTHLLAILRESVRHNDLEFSTKVVNGLMIRYRENNLDLRRKVGGLLCCPPKEDHLKDLIIEEVVSLYERKLIEYYEIHPWMNRGYRSCIPLYLKGNIKNSIMKKYLRDSPLNLIKHEIFISKGGVNVNITIREFTNDKSKIILNSNEREQLLDILAVKSKQLIYASPFELNGKWYTLWTMSVEQVTYYKDDSLLKVFRRPFDEHR
jgi:hypothetical protein